MATYRDIIQACINIRQIDGVDERVYDAFVVNTLSQIDPDSSEFEALASELLITDSCRVNTQFAEIVGGLVL